MNNADEQKELERVVSLLTPRHRRYPQSKSNIKMKSKRSGHFRWLALGGIAAMVAVIVTFSVDYQAHAESAPLPAAELAARALGEVGKAQECRVEFALRAVKTNAEEVYSGDINGEMINGTLSLSSAPDQEFMRVEWDDQQKTAFAFKGTDYVLTENGIEVKRIPTKFNIKKISTLLDLDSVINEFKNSDKYKFSEDGDKIMVTTQKNNPGYGLMKVTAVFSRSEGKLKSLTMTAERDGREIELLRTNSISYR